MLAAQAPSVEGRWEGAVELPGGRKFPIKFDIKRAEAGLQGTVEAQSDTRPLNKLRYDEPKIQFETESPQGTAQFEGKLDGDKITGNVGLAGQSFPFSVERKGGMSASLPTLAAGMVPREILFGNPERAQP